MTNRVVKRYLAKKELRRLIGLFYDWREARPFLRVSQCWYATSLLLAIIETYQQWVRFGGGRGLDHDTLIANLYRLLTEPPPHHTPPRAKAPGGVFI